MPSERWIAWLLFAFVMAITPGPNNVMLMASGARFGVRRTHPHCLGVALGFGAMFFAVELGAGVALASSRVLVEAMRWASVAFLAWIAWSIATAPVPSPVRAADAAGTADASNAADDEGPARGAKPLGFLGGAAFQWVNPKAWMLCIGAAGTYVPQDAGTGLVVAMSCVLAVITWVSAGTWMVAGQALREALRPPVRQRAFNLAMAVLLVVSVVPALRD